MYDKIIINESCTNLRTMGRMALDGKWNTSVKIIAIYMVCVFIPAYIFSAISGAGAMMSRAMNDMYAFSGNYDYSSYSNPGDFAGTVTGLGSLYQFLVIGAFTLGLTMCFLKIFRRQDVTERDIFDGFHYFIKALGLMFMVTLFICLWALLLIFPGVIAAIRYSQAFYILADEPDKPIMECIRESKELMYGNKGKYFGLQLSFIGWILLASIPMGILSSIGAIISDSYLILSIIGFIGEIGMFWVFSYIYATDAGFYEMLRGRANIEVEHK